MLHSPAFWEWHFREPQSHGVVVTPWYDMKCSLMSNVNMPVPPARGRSSLGLSAGMWWHFNGLFIPQNAFSHSRKKTHKKNKIGQQNLAGGRSDEARFSRWLRLLSKGEEKSGALSAIHGGSSQEHIYIWIRAIWLSHPRTKKTWWTIRGLLTRQKDRREMKNKKIQFGKKETSPSIVEELKNIYIYREREAS